METETEKPEGRAGGSVFSAVGLTLLGTTCCALPITLVALGAGGAVASMASSLPWLVALSKYKLATFGFTAAAVPRQYLRCGLRSTPHLTGTFAKILPESGEVTLRESDLERVWKTVWIYPYFRYKSKFLNDSAVWITLRT